MVTLLAAEHAPIGGFQWPSMQPRSHSPHQLSPALERASGFDGDLLVGHEVLWRMSCESQGRRRRTSVSNQCVTVLGENALTREFGGADRI